MGRQRRDGGRLSGMVASAALCESWGRREGRREGGREGKREEIRREGGGKAK